jgi:DNA-binding HxlR family transcriptional regulator
MQDLSVGAPSGVCPHRLFLLDQIADKWSVLILASLCTQPQRFNALKRRLGGITQKSLTQTLRRLERNGVIERRVIPTAPVAVEYSITPLGGTLKKPIQALYAWTEEHMVEVEKAQKAFDARTEKDP